MAVVIALAVMTGLQQELRDRLLGSSAHITVSKAVDGGLGDYEAEARKLSAVPGVVGAAPWILGKAVVTSSDGQEFVQLNGIDPALEDRVVSLDSAMTSGSLAGLKSGDADVPSILLGSEVAASLRVTVGDRVSVYTTEGTLTPVGIMPHRRTMRVAGIFSLKLSEVDSSFAYVNLETAEKMLDRSTVEFIQLKVANIWDAPKVAANIRSTFGPEYRTEDWTTMNKSLFSALSLEKLAVSLAIGLIVMVAALNIVASLILLVMEKHRDIAILKTMGATSRSVMLIFISQGLIIGLMGTTAGAVLGVVASKIFDHYQLIRVPADVYQVSYLPFIVLGGDLAMVIGVAVLICFGATIYPSRQAARLDPAQALRYE